jgi:hypothetical protein
VRNVGTYPFRSQLAKVDSLLKNPSTPLPGLLQGLKKPPLQCFGLDA